MPTDVREIHVLIAFKTWCRRRRNVRMQDWTAFNFTHSTVWSLMPVTHTQETRTRNLCKKLAWRISSVSCTKTTLWPITLQGSCHMPDSFCAMLNCRQETCTRKNFYKIGQHKSFLYKTTCTSFGYKFLERVLPTLDLHVGLWWMSHIINHSTSKRSHPDKCHQLPLNGYFQTYV